MAQTVLLGDICDVRDGTHDSPKPKDKGHPLVTSKHIKNNKIDFSTANLISDEDFEAVNKRSKVDKHDILISMIGTVGELALIDYEPTFAIKNIGLIKTGNDLLSRYLFYYLQGPVAKQYIEASLAGSTQKFIGLGLLRKFPIELPDKQVQMRITDILGAIDEKIELNRKMNETLEQMGQALFKKYFLLNPQAEIWEEALLGDFLKVERGLSYKGANLSEESTDVPMINLGSFSLDGTYNEGNIKYYNGDYKERTIVTPGGLVVANTDMTQDRVVLGAILRVPNLSDKVLFTHHVYGLRDLKLPEDFVYFLLKRSIFRERAQGFATGTTVLFMPSEAITKLQFKLPPTDVLNEFAHITRSIFERKEIIRREVQSLTDLRNSLLPRLISGKIKT